LFRVGFFIIFKNMKIDYENPVIMNIHKQWDGETDDGIKFVIDGGYNDYDGYYIESIIFTDEIENEDELKKEIESSFFEGIE